LNCEGIPEIVGRSNLRANQPEGGYNIVTIENGKISYRERHPGKTAEKDWAVAILQKHDFEKDTTVYKRPSYAINELYPFVQTDWKYQDEADIRCGIAVTKDLLITANTKGEIYALRQSDGKKVWHFQTGGKIFSTPAVEKDVVVIASTDSNLYCFKVENGHLCWRYPLGGTTVASPLIHDGNVYIGTSSGHFKAFRLKDGKMLWDFAQVKGFVESRAAFYKDRLYFASWGNELYALNAKSGQLDWKWSSGASNRMFSAAGTEPIIIKNKLFIVAPDRFMTSLDALSGQIIWRKHWDSTWVRQSMGISEDSSLVYVKTMQGRLLGISVDSSSPQITWHAELNLGYDLDPAVIRERQGVVYVPSDKGVVSAVDRVNGKVLWQYKIAHSQLNTVLPAINNRLFVSSADGIICCLRTVISK
jgi:outer membrane protein assembly factor BamB